MIAILRIVPVWAWLAAALALSAFGNLFQLHRSMVAAELAPLQAQLAAAEEQDRIARALAAYAARDAEALLTELRVIADRAKETEVRYVDRVRQLPAPACAPTAERVDAWNIYAEEARTHEPAAEDPGRSPGSG